MTTYDYRLLTGNSTLGEIRAFTLESPPPRPPPYFAYNKSWNESFYVGAELTYLGSSGALERDVMAFAGAPVRCRPASVSGRPSPSTPR